MASGVSGSNEKYEKLVSVIWGWAVKEAHDRKMNLCFGHTHQAMTFEDDFVKVIDCGARELATLS